MKNQDTSELIANAMNEALNSEEYSELFSEAAKKNDCKKCKGKPKCVCKPAKKDESSSSSSKKPLKKKAFDVAVESLLNASEALEELELEKSAALTLKVASLVIEAAKKKKDKSSSSSSSSSSSKKPAKKDEKKPAKKEDKKPAKK